MQSTLDAKLKDILQVVVGSVVGRVPGMIHDGTNFSVSDSSQLQQGFINGTLNLQIGAPSPTPDAKPTPVMTSQAQVAIRFFEGATSEDAVLNIITQGQVDTVQFIQFLQLLNQGVCIANADGSCSVKPVVDAADAGLPVSQQAKVAIERLKANLIAYLDAILATANTEEQQQSFGTPTESESTVDVEKMQKMRAAVEAGLKIAVNGADSVATIDMNAVRELSTNLSEINPALGVLQMFQVIEVTMGNSKSSYTLTVESKFPKKLIVNYDAYIKQQQSEDQLMYLHELVMKVTWWASGRCTKSKHQEMCMKKLLNSCANSVSSVGSCVTQVSLAQKAREWKNLLLGND